MKKKKAIVDEDLCIGCNTCPLVDPDTFEMNTDTYKAVVKKTAPDVNDKTEMACTSCPVGAISIVEEDL
jgi:ferredoxin